MTNREVLIVKKDLTVKEAEVRSARSSQKLRGSIIQNAQRRT